MKSLRRSLLLISLLLVSLACSLSIFYPPVTPNPSGVTDDPSKYDLSHGELAFVYDKTIISSEGWEIFIPRYGCHPASDFDEGGGYLNIKEGDVKGYCSMKPFSSERYPNADFSSTGILEGYFHKKSGEINFTFETQADYITTRTIDIRFEASGKFTSTNHAEGIADFMATCNPKGPDGQCDYGNATQTIRAKSYQVYGSVPWTMDFTP
jgi:hypothetical protein